MKAFAKTISIHLLATLERSQEDASFNYINSIIIRNNQVTFLPESIHTSFIDVKELDHFADVDIIEDNIRTVGINLVVNLTSEIDIQPRYRAQIDSIGSLRVTFEPDHIEIHEVIEEKDSALVTEEFEEESEANKVEEPSQEADQVEEKPEEVSTEEEKISAEVLEEKALIEDDEEDGPAWIVTYDLHDINEAVEDEASTDPSMVIHAPDLETAARLADQHARIKARENSSWDNAEVISIRKN